MKFYEFEDEIKYLNKIRKLEINKVLCSLVNKSLPTRRIR